MQYLLFHDLEDVLPNLPDAKPSFGRHRYVEILAEFEGGVVGKYRNVIFTLTTKDIKLSKEPIVSFTVEFASDDGSFKSFRYGKYSCNDKILIDGEYIDEFFHDFLPALLSELGIAELLLRDCIERAQYLAERETEIVKDIIRLSDEVRALSVERLEELSFELSSLRAKFFSRYMRFKDDVEEIFAAVSRASSISSFLGGMLAEKIESLKLGLEDLSYYESRFEDTLAGVRDALDVVHLRLEMLRGKENLELQKRTSSLQAAAAIIEFVAVYYYTLKIWETFLPIEKVPSIISFTVLTIFATLAILYTEALGEYLRKRRVSLKLVVLTLMLTLILILMSALPIIFSEV
ncbi:hypothetical protein [Archaeoglobus neptunius]|uniref:hypothetical protein n=1 Tax=Archaeoglobus neptunius TaxID=2798580 RepID=UPI00192910BA|nr:hypothetical protein [Archaeoglobus neptunius]